MGRLPECIKNFAVSSNFAANTGAGGQLGLNGQLLSPQAPSEASTAPCTPTPRHFHYDVNNAGGGNNNNNGNENLINLHSPEGQKILQSYTSEIDKMTPDEFFYDDKCFLPDALLPNEERKRNLKKVLFGPYFGWKRLQQQALQAQQQQQQNQNSVLNNGADCPPIPIIPIVPPKPEFLVCKEAGCCCVQYFKYALVESRKDQKLSQKDIVADQDRVTDLLMGMLEFDKNARYSCEEALDHPYLEGY